MSLKEKIKSKYFIFTSCFLILNIMFLALAFKQNNNNKLIYLIIPLIILIIISIYNYFIINKYHGKIKIEKLYLLLIIPISLFYLCLFPAGNLPDEGAHLMRSVEISEGKLVTSKDINKRYFDANYYHVYSPNYGNIPKTFKLNKTKNKAPYNYFNISLYSFICYIPQTIGILFAKLLHLPLIMQLYFARLFNFITFIILIYNAIKLLPIKKNFLLTLLFMPMTVQESITMSADALTIGVALLFVSYILNLKYSNIKKLSKKNYLLLLLMAIILSLCKIVYLPLCLFMLLIPKEKIGTTKNKIFKIGILILIPIIINLIWLSISSGYLPSNNNINSREQLKIILKNPIKYIFVLFNTFQELFIGLCLQFMGSQLGTFKVNLSDIYMTLLFILLIFELLFDNSKYKLNNKDKIISLSIFIIIILLINTSLYLQWTKLNSNFVDGLQGRYFIPIILLLAFVFDKYKINKYNFDNKIKYAFLTSLNIYACIQIFYTFL